MDVSKIAQFATNLSNQRTSDEASMAVVKLVNNSAKSIGQAAVPLFTLPQTRKVALVTSIRSIKGLSANINLRNPIQSLFFSRLFTVVPENLSTVRVSS